MNNEPMASAYSDLEALPERARPSNVVTL